MSQLRLAGSREKTKMERLVDRCGARAHLAIDALFTADDLRDYLPASKLAFNTGHELKSALRWLTFEPLCSALQDAAAAAAECRFCTTDEPLKVLHFSPSGSSAEGFSDLAVGPQRSTSDFDVMFEFGGSIRWAAGAGAGAEPDRISPKSAPQLWAKSTDRPGFVTLHWARTKQCSHESPLPALSADSVRQLMEKTCRVMLPPKGEITASGPAVNSSPDDTDGGADFVPCLRCPWWPEVARFLHRPRETDFLPKAARRDICRFGVHLVPTGRPGSSTGQIEWRLSFSQAEGVAALHLSARQRATVKAVKSIKNRLKDRGHETSLKSYFIKTAVLWLVQDQPIDRWTGVMEGVHMVLDWLELHLTAGSLPCFFWQGINLLSDLSSVELSNMISTVRMMRSQALPLLMASCDKMWPGLDLLLQGGRGPLSERQLRICLVRVLMKQAVVDGIMYRPTAPCWQHWAAAKIPALARRSEHRLLEWQHRRQSGVYRQQCYLLQALYVAPADLVGEVPLTSLGGDMFTWPVAPLLGMLTASDLQQLLGDRPAVAAWCHQQLCRPTAERPAGLTAELDTPQGRAEILLQPQLLLQAFSEAVLVKREWCQEVDLLTVEHWRMNYSPLPTYQQQRQQLERHLSCDLEARLRCDLPQMDISTAAATARCWRHRLQHLQAGDHLRDQYTAVITRRTDRWQLRQYVVLDSLAEGSPQCDEQWGGSLQERQERKQSLSYTQEQEELERRNCQELKEQERQRLEVLKKQEKQHLQERGKQEQQHRREREEKQHHQEREELAWRHRQERDEQERRHQQERAEQDLQLLQKHDEQGRQLLVKKRLDGVDSHRDNMDREFHELQCRLLQEVNELEARLLQEWDEQEQKQRREQRELQTKYQQELD